MPPLEQRWNSATFDAPILINNVTQHQKNCTKPSIFFSIDKRIWVILNSCWVKIENGAANNTVFFSE